MADTSFIKAREAALDRARTNAPFLREAILAFPEITAAFASDGAHSAISAARAIDGDAIAQRLRRQRRALALAVALGDLSGELSLEQLTARPVRFCRFGDRSGARRGDCRTGRDAGTTGFAVLALGKLGSRELNYSSDVDLVLLFDPATLARRERDDPGESAVRIARRLVELLQQRDRGRLCRAGRLAAPPVARGDPDRAARRCRHFLLRSRRRCRGSGRPSSARGRRQAISRSASASCAKSSRSSGAGRSISARSTKSATFRPASATIMRKARRSPRAMI